MLEHRRWPLVLWGVGCSAVVAGLPSPPMVPRWAWTCLCLLGIASALLGSSARESGGEWVRRGNWLMALGCIWQTVLTGGVLVRVGLHLVSPVLFWGAMLALIPALFTFVDATAGIQGRRPPSWAVAEPAVVGGWLRGAGARGDVATLLLSLLFTAGGLLIALRETGDMRYFGLGVSLFFGGGVPIAARRVMLRWSAWHPSHPRVPGWLNELGVLMMGLGCGLLAASSEDRFPVVIRALFAAAFIAVLAWAVWRLLARLFSRGAPRVWFAREGLVEETPDARVLFPWMRISRVDLTELRGSPVVMVWFRDEERPFQVLDLQLGDPEREEWVARRSAALQTNLASSGAPLVLGEAVLEESPLAAYEQIRRIAANQGNLLDLPSVLDDPPEVDLSGLGLG